MENLQKAIYELSCLQLKFTIYSLMIFPKIEVLISLLLNYYETWGNQWLKPTWTD